MKKLTVLSLVIIMLVVSASSVWAWGMAIATVNFSTVCSSGQTEEAAVRVWNTSSSLSVDGHIHWFGDSQYDESFTLGPSQQQWFEYSQYADNNPTQATIDQDVSGTAYLAHAGTRNWCY